MRDAMAEGGKRCEVTLDTNEANRILVEARRVKY